MFGLPLPWLLLAVVLAVGSAGAMGYSVGVDVESGKRDKAVAEAQNAALELARQDAEAAAKRAAEERERAVRDARRKAEADAALTGQRLKNEIAALKSRPMPDCSMPASDVDRLREYIRAANRASAVSGTAANPGDMPGTMPKPAGTGERRVDAKGAVGGASDRHGGEVPYRP